MVSRLLLLFATVFFLAMNVWLWRSEIVGRSETGSLVPAGMVYEKVINAADISTLEIRHQGQKIGYCRWMPTIGEAHPGAARPETESPEGMVRQPTGYTLDLNGHLAWDEENRVRFTCDLTLGTNQAWQEFNLRVQFRPYHVEVRAMAADESIRLTLADGTDRQVRLFKFADLRQPEKLLRELGGPLLPATVSALGLSLQLGPTSNLAKSLSWEARHDWLRVGHSRIRVYRLQARLLDRFQAVVVVSPAGEILRVELPDNLVLINDALVSF